MSLPKAFSTSEEYFDHCLKFLAKYEYLISVPNTHVLVENVLDNISAEDLVHVDMYDENSKLSDLRDKSRYIDEFLKEVEILTVGYESVEEKDEVVVFEAPVSEKKKYEVIRLADEVGNICKEYGCDTVIDFGSGLGYLDQRFHSTTGLNVLGLECDEGHHSRAVLRQRKYHQPSLRRVVYHQLRIEEHSAPDVENCLKENFESHGPVCITGLHACGDLTVDGINIFLKMDDVRTLILMPCCYHRMTQQDDKFKNFPLSALLRRVVDQGGVGEAPRLGAPLLRLAAHPSRGQELGQMVCSLLARAVLEMYAWTNKCTLKRNKRKPIKKCESFAAYAAQAAAGYALQRAGPPVAFDLDQLRTMWNNLPETTFKKAAVYIQLQNWLQPIAENLVLHDRLVYLQENGVRKCWHRKFFKEDQSPRCIALLAVKDR